MPRHTREAHTMNFFIKIDIVSYILFINIQLVTVIYTGHIYVFIKRTLSFNLQNNKKKMKLATFCNIIFNDFIIAGSNY